MIRSARLLFRSALIATALLAPVGGTAVAQTIFMTRPLSATGNYLAGREALQALRTADAAKYFSQAATADWEDVDVVERAFTAYAANGQIGDAATQRTLRAALSSLNDALVERRDADARRNLAQVYAAIAPFRTTSPDGTPVDPPDVSALRLELIPAANTLGVRIP